MNLSRICSSSASRSAYSCYQALPTQANEAGRAHGAPASVGMNPPLSEPLFAFQPSGQAQQQVEELKANGWAYFRVFGAPAAGWGIWLHAHSSALDVGLPCTLFPRCCHLCLTVHAAVLLNSATCSCLCVHSRAGTHTVYTHKQAPRFLAPSHTFMRAPLTRAGPRNKVTMGLDVKLRTLARAGAFSDSQERW